MKGVLSIRKVWRHLESLPQVLNLNPRLAYVRDVKKVLSNPRLVVVRSFLERIHPAKYIIT